MSENPVTVAPAPYVTIALAAVITGLSEKAIRRKIEDGKWLEGREYRRSPDGGIFVSTFGWNKGIPLSTFKSRAAQPAVELEPTPVPHEQGECFLYRHFDSSDRLLYIGISLSAVARLSAHNATSPWARHVARVQIIAYRCRADALVAERLAIRRERPIHNAKHNTRRLGGMS